MHERIDAIGKLEGYDSEKVAEALVEAFGSVEEEVRQVDEERFQLNVEIAEILERVGPSRKFTDQKMFADYREMQEKSTKLRKRLDALRDLQFELRTRVLRLESKESLEFLVKEVLADKKQPLFLKLTISALAERMDQELVEDLERALRQSKRSTEIVPLLDTLAETKNIGKRLADRILKLLEHKEEAVRERAALCLAKLEWRAAVVPLIDMLEKEEGMTQKRIAAALAEMTGMTLGTMVASWRGWWEKEGEDFMRNGKKSDPVDDEPVGVRPGRRGEPKMGGGGEYGYFGIPQDGKALIYVIDSSGSMKAEIDRKRTGSVKSGESGNMTRLDGCKEELIGALERLQNGKRFNVIHYSDLPHQWKPKLVTASAETKKEAIEWVRELQPTASTNIHDAMQMAFGLAGRGARDQYYESEVDTIFLLSDGTPTKPNGELDDTDKILKAVRTWNAMNRVTVHAIAIGKDLNVKFLQQLAAENGGEFRQAMK